MPSGQEKQELLGENWKSTATVQAQLASQVSTCKRTSRVKDCKRVDPETSRLCLVGGVGGPPSSRLGNLGSFAGGGDWCE